MVRRREIRTCVAVLAVLTLLTSPGCTAADVLTPEPTAVAELYPSPLPVPSDGELSTAATLGLRAVLAEVVAESRRFPVSDRGALGLTVSVVSDEGTWSGAAGVDGGGVLLVPESSMAVGHVSTTFVVAELMHLAATGVLGLDRPAADYLDHPLIPEGVTTRQLMGMRGGVRDGDLDLAVVLADPGRSWTATEVLAAAAAPSEPPDSDPVYADSSFVLLQLLVEAVTGRPLAESIEADLLDPAGLERVALQDTQAPPPPLAAPASHRPLGPPDGYLPYRSLASFAGAAGGMACDAPTLARWGYELYGGRLLGMPAVTEMTNAPDAQLAGVGASYGLGTMRFRTAFGLDAVGHVGDVDGYSSVLAVVPQRHLAVAVLVVGDGKDTWSFVERVVAAALARR